MKADKPTLIAYTVKDGQGAEPKAIWTRIGRLGRIATGAAIPFVWKHCPWMAELCWWCLSSRQPGRPSRCEAKFQIRRQRLWKTRPQHRSTSPA